MALKNVKSSLGEMCPAAKEAYWTAAIVQQRCLKSVRGWSVVEVSP